MITNSQATELREHLIREMQDNGFSNIVNEVNSRLKEDYTQDSQNGSQFLLTFYLEESIDILENLSNKDYPGLIKRFNNFLVTNNDLKADQLQSIVVQLLSDGKEQEYDLANLPNYENVISILKKALEEIRSEN
ncbi:hypothetical protein [Chryseobacterium sp. Marseille-Q3244]|uniref:hypothetical protein n=1 Tax=Chryseobacterium sp. Marseille-Q3244 TaxID=2758092 RepID=UPI002024A3FC|nr:hypothetical protein [Chryseobacterium sp. Marseille-Q3244]